MKKVIMFLMMLMSVSIICAEDNFKELSELQPDFTKWKIVNINKLGLKNGYIQMILTRGYPMIFTPKVFIDANKVKTLTFKMKLLSQSKLSGHILFTTKDDNRWNEAKRIIFKCSDDGKLHTYNVDMSKNKKWKGIITQLRITPAVIPVLTNERYLELGPGFTDLLEPYFWKWKSYGIKNNYNYCSIPTTYAKKSKKMQFINMVRTRNIGAKIVFLGDSITDLWEFHPKYQNGSKIWKKYYVPMNVENFAISGDKTENILWQLTDGNMLHDMKPQLFVMMIGVNNVMRHDNPNSIAEGIQNILKVLQKSYPKAKILLLNILPSCMEWDKQKVIYTDSRKVNSLIKSFADNKKIFYLDTSKEFLDNGGKVDSSNFYDGLHLTEKGFKTWDKALRPKIIELMKK